jgi:hypothetical protein
MRKTSGPTSKQSLSKSTTPPGDKQWLDEVRAYWCEEGQALGTPPPNSVLGCTRRALAEAMLNLMTPQNAQDLPQ